MKKYVESMKEYEEISGKYEEIYNISRNTPYYTDTGIWKNHKLSSYVDSGPLYSLWDLEKFQVQHFELSLYIDALGLGKILREVWR